MLPVTLTGGLVNLENRHTMHAFLFMAIDCTEFNLSACDAQQFSVHHHSTHMALQNA